MDLQLTSAWDVPNLRCLPVVRASDAYGTRKLSDIYLDSAYFHYQASPAACTQSRAEPSCQFTAWRAQRLGHCIQSHAACVPRRM